MSFYKTTSRKRVKSSSLFPGYHSKMPLVFPYHWRGTIEEVANLVKILVTEDLDGARMWFGVTGHYKTTDGHVILWLSTESAQFLLNGGLIAAVIEYEVEVSGR